mmetsp:Transcript_44830/g.112717  ORF Transcript_44830/g.112717 Transcript_44830/m.112717 type:complete len:212 (-) Transcript_44830:27-662(-)
MATEAWRSAGSSITTSLRGAWLVRHGSLIWALPQEDRSCEAPCQELLQAFVNEFALSGVRPSQPWREFFGELRAPDHAAQRVPSNVERYAGNYINVAFGGALLLAFLSQPVLTSVLSGLQAVAVLAPPEIFDVHMLQPKRWGGGFKDVGGAWLRLVLVILSHGSLWLLTLSLWQARSGALLAVLASLLHALLRTRPWTEMAKERLGMKKRM